MSQFESQVENIAIPYPEAESASLALKIAIGTLTLRAADNTNTNQLVTGNIVYDVPEWKPEVHLGKHSVIIQQGDERMWSHWENFLGQHRNEWDLALGTTKVFDLNIKSGVAPATLSLGGVPLSSLIVKMGVGMAKVRFDAPNPTLARLVKFGSGLGGLEIASLLNVNAKIIDIDGGAGQVRLDMGDIPLEHDVTLNVSTGLGNITLDFADSTPARILTSTGLGSVQSHGTWNTNGRHSCETVNFNSTQGPKILVNVRTGMGSIAPNMRDKVSAK